MRFTDDGTQEGSNNELVELTIDKNGRIAARTNVTDYKLRGVELESFSFYAFMRDTYDEAITKHSNSGEPEENDSQRPKRGRPRNIRSSYLPDHPKAQQYQRVMRTPGHNTIPNFVGQWLPRNDIPETRDFYCANALALLKPWRDVTDLKGINQTWREAFDIWSQQAPKEEMDILDNFQYYYNSEKSANEKCQNNYTQDDEPAQQMKKRRTTFEQEMEIAQDLPEESIPYSEAEVNAMLESDNLKDREKLHGLEAVRIGQLSRLFENDDSTWTTVAQDGYSASGGDLLELERWKRKMEQQVTVTTENDPQPSKSAEVQTIEGVAEDIARVEYLESFSTEFAPPQPELEPQDVEKLLTDQKRAYEIVEWHLKETLKGHRPPQLLKQIQGEGGTGKSTVIQTITELFANLGASHLLMKCAYTGIAASIVGGSTLHKLFSINAFGIRKDGQRFKPLTVRKLQALEEKLKHTCYLIPDEVSMFDQEFFAYISEVVKKGKAQNGDGSKPFGGVNVIICGDFHQFPPVGSGPKLPPLYWPGNRQNITVEQQTGRAIYEQFTTVVILKEQVC
jgi:hypothetical protein